MPGAEAALRELVALFEKHDPDSWTPFHTMSLLGAVLDRLVKECT